MPKKIGRPTDSPKTIKLQIRVDENTLREIDYCTEKLNTNRSEIIRRGIKIIRDGINE